ncbi:MAG: FxLYD domain-containing protein, partial [Caldilineaceae bacterium]
ANSLRLTPPGALESAPLETLSFVTTRNLSVVHTSAWTTPEGVFYVTGEVSNQGPLALNAIPVEVTLTTADGTVVQGALDQTLGHAVPPGGFAPFSLRFGGGQPDPARGYVVRVGGDGWTPAPAEAVLGAESLTWTDEAAYTGDGALVVSGEAANTGASVARQARATVTVFDAAGHVIGAASSELTPPTLSPGERAPYRFVFNELGGAPAQYVVNVQALP